MKKISNIFSSALLPLCLLCVCGCSVKEDRYECPCKFTVDIGFCSDKWNEILLFLWGEDSKILSKTLFPVSVTQETYDIRRGKWPLAVCAGLSESEVEGENVVIGSGGQADELFIYSSLIDATGEYAEAEVVPHKQYMLLTLDLSQYEIPGFFTGVEIIGNVCGINMVSLDPLEGDFRYILSANGSGEYKIRIPRQRDSSLELSLTKDGAHNSSIPIGKYIVQSGYDWGAEDLDDIKVTINLNNAEVVVEVQDWDIVESYREYVI